ncbi:hypothetical protein ANO11243_074470 [Dothideomycetidae sp. 11243]|nr:hypothetical protein ANO11243_074470 [fungal sp. No.11243]
MEGIKQKTLLDLPHEVLGLICRQVDDNNSLLSLATANKDLYVRLRPHLYSSIVLRELSSSQCARLFQDHEGDRLPEESPRYWPGILSLLSSLSDSRPTRESVRDLTVIYCASNLLTYGWTQADLTTLEEDAFKVLQRETTVEHITDDQSCEAAFFDLLVSSLLNLMPSLHSLEILSRTAAYQDRTSFLDDRYPLTRNMLVLGDIGGLSSLQMLTRLSLRREAYDVGFHHWRMSVDVLHDLIQALPRLEEFNIAWADLWTDKRATKSQKQCPGPDSTMKRLRLNYCNLEPCCSTLAPLFALPIGLQSIHSLFGDFQVLVYDWDSENYPFKGSGSVWAALAPHKNTLQDLHLEWDDLMFLICASDEEKLEYHTALCRYDLGDFSIFEHLRRLYIADFWIAVLVRDWERPQSTRQQSLWAALPPRLEELGILCTSNLPRIDRSSVPGVLLALPFMLDGSPGSLKLLILEIYAGHFSADESKIPPPVEPFRIAPYGQVDLLITRTYYDSSSFTRQHRLWAYSSAWIRGNWWGKMEVWTNS